MIPSMLLRPQLNYQQVANTLWIVCKSNSDLKTFAFVFCIIYYICMMYLPIHVSLVLQPPFLLTWRGTPPTTEEKLLIHPWKVVRNCFVSHIRFKLDSKIYFIPKLNEIHDQCYDLRSPVVFLLLPFSVDSSHPLQTNNKINVTTNERRTKTGQNMLLNLN